MYIIYFLVRFYAHKSPHLHIREATSNEQPSFVTPATGL